jgi:hypothetical protein
VTTRAEATTTTVSAPAVSSCTASSCAASAKSSGEEDQATSGCIPQVVMAARRATPNGKNATIMGMVSHAPARLDGAGVWAAVSPSTHWEALANWTR